VGSEEQEKRRAARRAAYLELKAKRPELFDNPPNNPYEILFDRDDQDHVAESTRALDVPEEYSDIGIVYQDPYVMLVRDAVRFRNGSRGGYIRACGAGDGTGAAVLPVLDDGRIVLLWHFRHSDRAWHWEIPRGFGEEGSGAAETARREVGEELGCEVQELTHLGAMNGNSGIFAGDDQIYLARLDGTTLATTPTPAAVLEGIDEVRPVDLGTFRTMIATGEITDGYTLTAYAFAVAKGLIPAG
jgi:ADP-ribose pyrophosphatase